MSKEIEDYLNTSHVTLNQNYWDNQYVAQATGWDLGAVSPPIKKFIDGIKDKHLSILIPGCGNGYEAEYLLQQGFTNITVIDIAPTLVGNLKAKFKHNASITILLGDFFEHQNTYDVIIEQTFFCALPPTFRQKYVAKMYQLLNTNGLLVGLLFNRSFEKNPPFGGNKVEYEALFKNAFEFLSFDITPISVAPRANSELWIELKKQNDVVVTLYTIAGITCMGCKTDITTKILKMNTVLNASINTSFTELLVVSSKEIDILHIENEIETSEKRYTLIKN